MGEGEGKDDLAAPGVRIPPWEGHQQFPSPDSLALTPRFPQLWNVEFCSPKLSRPFIREYPPVLGR